MVPCRRPVREWYNQGMTSGRNTPSPTAGLAAARRPVAAWLAGRIEYGDYAALAERLAWEVSEPQGRCPTLVVCELEPVITIGRLGSRTDVRLSADELRDHRIEMKFTGRGGGAVPHVAGQVFAALFASLDDLGLAPHDVAGLVARLESGTAGALEQVQCGTLRLPGVPGVFGRSGMLAAWGLAVRRGVVSHGAFVNVRPDPDLLPRVDVVPAACRGRHVPTTTMGSIEGDLQRPVRMQDVRTALVHSIAAAFAFPRVLVHSGFPGGIPATGRRGGKVVSHAG